MLTGYVLIFYWTIVAVGAALFLGTGAALVRSRRTGALPGGQAAGDARAPTRSETTRAVVRCVLGLALAGGGAAGLLATM